MINFTLLLIIYILFFHKQWWDQGFISFFLRIIMYTYICMVIMVTLMPLGIREFIPGGNNLFLKTANLIPYRDIRAGYLGAVRESILNVIMLLPFGFLLPFIKKMNVCKIVGLSFLFSLTIECAQLFFMWSASAFSRSFDVTDLINNTIGGLIGYVFYKILISFIQGKRTLF